MNENKDIKPKSFRIDEETANRFKEIAASIGGNQQQTMAKLIESYEFQSGKAILIDKKADIEQFEKYVGVLTRMFMSSLEDNQNLSTTIRSEFEAMLISKDKIIKELQDKMSEGEQLKKDLSDVVQNLNKENIELKSSLEKTTTQYENEIINLNKMIEDKNNLNKALTDSCNDLKNKVNDMEKSVEDYENILKKLNTLEKDYKNILAKNKSYISQISLIEKQKEEDSKLLKEQMQLQMDKALLQQEKQYQKNMDELKSQYRTEVDKYQEQYMESLKMEKLHSKEIQGLRDKMQKEIDFYKNKYYELQKNQN